MRGIFKFETMQDLTKVFLALLDFYQPVYTIQESSDQLSTAEIAEKIEDLTGSEIENSDVYQYLEENGFKYKYTVEGFRWLVKINPNN